MKPRVSRVLLIASVLLNIFFISWMGSQWIKHRVVNASLLDGAIDTLPAAARPVFKKHIKPDKEALVAALKQVIAGRQAISKLSGQPQLNVPALEAATQQVRDNLNIALGLVQQVMLATMQELPPAVRQEWSTQWQQQGDVLLVEAVEKLSQELDK